MCDGQTKGQILRQIKANLRELEGAIRTHPPQTVQVYEQGVEAHRRGMAAADDTSWSHDLGLSLHELNLVHRYLAASAFVSSWWEIRGDKERRDMAVQTACLTVVGLGLPTEAALGQVLRYEVLWSEGLESAGVSGESASDDFTVPLWVKNAVPLDPTERGDPSERGILGVSDPQGGRRGVEVSGKQFRDWERRGLVRKAEDVVAAHILDTTGGIDPASIDTYEELDALLMQSPTYDVEPWRIGQDIEREAYDRFANPETGDLYVIRDYRDGETSQLVVKEVVWRAALGASGLTLPTDPAPTPPTGAPPSLEERFHSTVTDEATRERLFAWYSRRYPDRSRDEIIRLILDEIERDNR